MVCYFWLASSAAKRTQRSRHFAHGILADRQRRWRRQCVDRLHGVHEHPVVRSAKIRIRDNIDAILPQDSVNSVLRITHLSGRVSTSNGTMEMMLGWRALVSSSCQSNGRTVFGLSLFVGRSLSSSLSSVVACL